MPRASRTSAAPQRELMERLPCLATRTPAPATTKAAAVEMLKVLRVSPPVPQVSISGSLAANLRPCGKIGAAWRRITLAKPTSSSTVSPFMRRAARKPAIWASFDWPVRMRSMADSASRRERSSPEMIFSRASWRVKSEGAGADGWG